VPAEISDGRPHSDQNPVVERSRARPCHTVSLHIGWVTDIHLNFLSFEKRLAFYERIKHEKLDALLVGGDIGEADSVSQILAEFAAAIEIPLYFVLGNHDFYRGSIANVRNIVTRLCISSAWLHWLPATGVVPLTADTALIGHDSWADGRIGDFFGSEVMLNDYSLIGELCGLLKPQRLAKLNALGDEAALFLEDHARQALAHWRNVLVLTHVPPFRESCWHEGKVSAEDYLPHFACQAVGDRLAALMRKHPQNNMTVLCGHTHSSGIVQILDNLSVLTGGADYGRPELQRVIDLD
jgi:Icc-related predicted phosphoesterase